MNKKNLLVSFCTVAIFLVLVSTAFAATTEIANITSVEINGLTGEDVAVIAGETISVKVFFTALENASDVRMEAELEGTKLDVEEKTGPFDLEEGKRYVKTLRLSIPYELKDEISDDFALNIEIWNGDFRTEYPEITLRIQRPSYHAEIMSISTSQRVEAGDILAVDVVLKNIGYNEIDDMYVTLRISDLNLERSSYFGDLVALEDDDNEDYVRGRFYLRIPYSAQEGVYTLEVEATNDDLTVTKVKQLIIDNDFPENVIATSTRKIVAAGEEAEYTLLLVNPTNKLKVYRIVTESSSNLISSANSAVVAVPAGLSKTVIVTATAQEQGEYMFNVNVFSGENLESVVTFSLVAEGRQTNPIAVLTIILAIIFLVLLVVLIVLIGKKPKKTEEFGESYY